MLLEMGHPSVRSASAAVTMVWWSHVSIAFVTEGACLPGAGSGKADLSTGLGVMVGRPAHLCDGKWCGDRWSAGLVEGSTLYNTWW